MGSFWKSGSRVRTRSQNVVLFQHWHPMKARDDDAVVMRVPVVEFCSLTLLCHECQAAMSSTTNEF